MRTRDVAVSFALLVAVALVFWLGRYRYDEMRNDGGSGPVRTNRFTGQSERLTPSGWKPLRPSEPGPPAIAMPSDAVKALTGEGQVTGSVFSANIYNGSNWSVQELIFHIKSAPAQFHYEEKTGLPSRGAQPGYYLDDQGLPIKLPPLWERDFRAVVRIAPMTTTEVSFVVGDAHGPGSSWSITSAHGFPPAN